MAGCAAGAYAGVDLQPGEVDLIVALGPFRDACRRGDEEAASIVPSETWASSHDSESVAQRRAGLLLWQGYRAFRRYFLVLRAGASGSAGVSPVALAAEHGRRRVCGKRCALRLPLISSLCACWRRASLWWVTSWRSAASAAGTAQLEISAAQLIANVCRVAGEVPAPASCEGGQQFGCAVGTAAACGNVWYADLPCALLV